MFLCAPEHNFGTKIIVLYLLGLMDFLITSNHVKEVTHKIRPQRCGVFISFNE